MAMIWSCSRPEDIEVYTPTTPPSGDIQQWLYGELLAISNAFRGIEEALTLKEHVAPPAKPRERQIVFADGTNWNPGSGRGVYCFSNGAWRFLG